ncbi:MAG: hypothetical protein JJU05_09400 [Verrucomicrobia bacterium]|nr:hypothetical protein [Verrucomicrobiota bacterium]MCH8526033.1 hypothetical protein [Kiritimatiellia bacterium]
MTPPLLGIDIDDTLALWTDDPAVPPAPAPGSAAVLEAWLRDDLVRIIYITSRKRIRREETVLWLSWNQYPSPKRVLFEEDIPRGKPNALLALGATGLVDDMPRTQEAASAAGLRAYWRDIPKNNHMPPPASHAKLHPWHDWSTLDDLVRSHFAVLPQ